MTWWIVCRPSSPDDCSSMSIVFEFTTRSRVRVNPNYKCNCIDVLLLTFSLHPRCQIMAASSVAGSSLKRKSRSPSCNNAFASPRPKKQRTESPAISNQSDSVRGASSEVNDQSTTRNTRAHRAVHSDDQTDEGQSVKVEFNASWHSQSEQPNHFERYSNFRLFRVNFLVEKECPTLNNVLIFCYSSCWAAAEAQKHVATPSTN